jgi:outer membrane protein OmpA-like peptidoglycan-associated protein
MTLTPSLQRRSTHSRRLTLVIAVTAALLAGCAIPAPTVAPPPFTASRTQALEAMGFAAMDSGWEFSLTGKLLFDVDSDQLDAETQSRAARLGRELARLGIDQLRIEGHTDSVGSHAYNEALSLRRAQAVADILVRAGLHDAKIEVYGLGPWPPTPPATADCKTAVWR